MMKALLFFLISSLCSFSQTKAPLGLPETLEDLFIPRPKIEVIPRTNNESSLVIRILKIKPAAEGFRYDLEIYALDPGIHRISQFLRYATDRSPVQSLDATFEVTTTHPLDTLPKPSEPEPVEPEKLGGYKNLIIILGTFWVLIFFAIIFPINIVAPYQSNTIVSRTTGVISLYQYVYVSESIKNRDFVIDLLEN